MKLLDMNQYIVDGYIVISKKQLPKLVDALDKEGVVDFISDMIDIYNVPLPIERPTWKEAKADHQRLLETDCTVLLKKGDTETRYPSKHFKLSGKYIDSSRIGNKASNYFHHNSRMLCDSRVSPSPVNVWHTPHLRKSALRSIFSMKHEYVDKKILMTCIALRRYIASQFRPSSAKALYDTYAREGAVLDMCSGWGDRLEGFLTSSALEYTGFDTNINLFEGYNDQIRTFKKPEQKAKIHYCPFEKSMQNKLLPRNHYNIAFTSPPYFNIEQYSKDEGQSYIAYKTSDVWAENFLIPLAEIAMDSLVKGGKLMVNISDVYTEGGVARVCDQMNWHLRKMGFKEGRHSGYKMQKRVASVTGSIPGVFVEPIWCWTKN